MFEYREMIIHHDIIEREKREKEKEPKFKSSEKERVTGSFFFLYYNTLEIGSNYVFIEQRLFMTDKFERLTLV